MAVRRLRRICLRVLLVVLGCVGIALWVTPVEVVTESLPFPRAAKHRTARSAVQRSGVPIPARLRLPARARSAAHVLSAVHVIRSPAVSKAMARKKKKLTTRPTTAATTTTAVNSNDGLCTNLTALISLYGLGYPRHPIPKTPRPCHKNLPCDWTPKSLLRPTRIQASLHCGNLSASMSFSEVKSGVTLTSARDRKCLKRVIHEKCRRGHQMIPKVVHYVHSGDVNLTLETFVSVLNVARFMKPCLVLFHGHSLPQGEYWQALLQLVPNILHVPSSRSHGRGNNKSVEGMGDVTRLGAVFDFGGIYLDTNFLLLQPLDHLLNHPTVMGTTTTTTSSSTYHIIKGFFMGQAQAPFLKLCLSQNFTHFHNSKQTAHFPRKIARLAQDFPQMVHVVDSFFGPGRSKNEKVHNGKGSKSNRTRYGFRLRTGMGKKKVKGGQKPLRLDRQDNVMGDVVRRVLYGDASACHSAT